MTSTHSLTTLRRIALAGAAAAALAATGHDDAAGKAAAPTGIFTGAIEHRAAGTGLADGEIRDGALLLRVYRDGGARRITGIYASTRTFCPGETIRDVVIDESREGRGPKLGPKGGFTYRAKGVLIEGVVGRTRAEGTVVANPGGGCHGSGTFTLKKRPGS